MGSQCACFGAGRISLFPPPPSEPSEEFDLGAFNAGRHVAAGEGGARAEAISAVLYPSDESEEGKELRLKQEYFLVSATLQVGEREVGI